ncbi:MAG: hypothetical protein DI551_04525 [Micavibrio aeruginosavorus]|uniref:Uncharacterized protein n=1 Tax=Micavibrio aeruginosavorus TaxID=349221 RepID=A0A2W5N382_9BACT|nr:MAG: hypothetical protein DI551_04525 [Micavibrio aeruginosavorus]
MNMVCEADSKVMIAEQYSFDCSPDPKTAYIISKNLNGTGYTAYYKLRIEDQYADMLDHMVFLKIDNLGDEETNRSDAGPEKGCNKKRTFYAGPETYMRKAY